MRVYDVALVMVRTIAGMDLVRAACMTPFTIMKAMAIVRVGQSSAALAQRMSVFVVSELFGPIESVVIALILLALAKRIARFASTFAAANDAAAEF